MTRSDLDRALFHADPLPYEDGADGHDHELAMFAADRAGEHTGIDYTKETRMIDLAKAPVGLTITVQDCEILIAALLHYNGGGTVRRLQLLGHVSNCMDASMEKHRDAGVREAVRPSMRVLPTGTVVQLRPDHAA